MPQNIGTSVSTQQTTQRSGATARHGRSRSSLNQVVSPVDPRQEQDMSAASAPLHCRQWDTSTSKKQFPSANRGCTAVAASTAWRTRRMVHGDVAETRRALVVCSARGGAGGFAALTGGFNRLSRRRDILASDPRPLLGSGSARRGSYSGWAKERSQVKDAADPITSTAAAAAADTAATDDGSDQAEGTRG
jgi:hypothetical protein